MRCIYKYMTTQTTDLRQERGLSLSQNGKIKHIAGATWLVPSQTQASGGYVVNTQEETCTCPDYELRQLRCKHQWSVQFSQTVTEKRDGSKVTTQTFSYARMPNQGRDWNAYNASQCEEKHTVEHLLRGLCDGIQTPEHKGRGRKPMALSDATFGMAMKVYSTMSARRATTDLEASKDAGHMDKAPRYNTLFDYFDKPEMTALLTSLIEKSAQPLASIERAFAVDSTGFGTAVYRRWYDQKYGREMKEHTWLKAHAIVGTTTNIVTSVKVTGSEGADCPELPGLVDATKASFQMAEVSADKAYLSHENLAAIESAGASPFVPFKVNSSDDGSPAWRKMRAVFMFQRDEFLASYAKRSRVESTFSAMKRKFGQSVRSKTFTAQVNEILCKVLCHNLSCLVHAMHSLGIAPSFLGKAVA
jgi:transposase